MAMGQVKRMHESNGRPVHVVGRNGVSQWHPVFENNPRLCRAPHVGYQQLVNGPGARPYIAGKTKMRWMWQPFDLTPGELYLSAQEREFAHPHHSYVFVEPNVKQNGHDNKAWQWSRWQRLIEKCIGLRFVQCGPAGTRFLAGVHAVVTPTFRDACAVLAVSRAFVGAEGGLHHAAAALGVPAVVLFSEFISPEITGYPMHRNLRHAGEPCGWRVRCQRCAESMSAITVDEVASNLWEILR